MGTGTRGDIVAMATFSTQKKVQKYVQKPVEIKQCPEMQNHAKTIGHWNWHKLTEM
jgi:hypothetical protein